MKFLLYKKIKLCYKENLDTFFLDTALISGGSPPEDIVQVYDDNTLLFESRYSFQVHDFTTLKEYVHNIISCRHYTLRAGTQHHLRFMRSLYFKSRSNHIIITYRIHKKRLPFGFLKKTNQAFKRGEGINANLTDRRSTYFDSDINYGHGQILLLGPRMVCIHFYSLSYERDTHKKNRYSQWFDH